MGSASCKNPKSSPTQDQAKETNKKITIGVFGLDNAGKTSAVKAIEGAPTEDVEPTIGSKTSQVPYPTSGKKDKKSQDRITLIDVSGLRSYRQRSWSNFYQQIHGLIFVLDASEKKRLTENKDTLEDLLEHPDLKDKPILILANKQDCRHAIRHEDDVKEKLDIENLRRKHKIELCQATPTANNKPDESIRTGFSWLIRTIEENYSTLSARVTNGKSPVPTKSPLSSRRRQKSEASDDDVVYAGKRKITTPPPASRRPFDSRFGTSSLKLPDLNLNKSKTKTSGNETYDESDDDNARSRSRPNISRLNDDPPLRSLNNSISNPALNKKKKLTGTGQKDGETASKKSNDNEPKSFRSTYESFPDEAPWSSTIKKPIKTDDFPYRMNTKSLLGVDPLQKRAISPLVHDTKFSTNNSLSKRNSDSDEDKNKSTFNRTSQRLSDRSNFNNDYRGTIPGLRSKLDDDKDLLSKPFNRSSFLKDDVLSPYSKPTAPAAAPPARFNSSFDDDKDRFKSPIRSRLSGLDSLDRPISASKINTLSRYTDENTKLPPKQLSSRSKHDDDDDDLPSSTSKFGLNSKYNSNYSSSISKPLTQKKSDDDDDLPSLTKPANRIGARGLTRSSPSPPPLSNSKFNSRSKLNDDDEDKYGSSSKLPARSNFKSNNRPSSPLTPLKTNSRWKDDDDDLPPKSSARYNSKPTTRLSPSPPPYSKPNNRSKFGDDDDDDDRRPKPTTRSTFGSTRRSSPSPPPSKSNNRSKFEDDDDDDLPSKTPARSNYKSSYRSSPSPPPSKSNNRSKFEDDDDDDDRRSKPTTRSTFGSTRRSSPSPPPSKQNNRSKFEDDDDDDLPSKTPARSNYKSSYRSSPSPPPYSKPSSQSKFEDDDDDYTPSSKRDNFNNNSRSRSTKDEYDSYKGGYGSGRFRSNS